METKEKHHYRKVFKSDHLGIADLEDFIEEKKPLVFMIKEVKQEMGVSVAGKKGNFNIAYFVEKIKPLVLNATNSKVVKMFAGGSPFVEDWNNIMVELFIDDTVKMKGEVVGGVRIRSIKPTLPPLTKEKTAAYNNAIAHIRGGGSWANIETRFTVTKEIKQQIENDVKT
ncbi:MAG: hypothetical protein V4608_10800 [Bacteroidota bacterium]